MPNRDRPLPATIDLATRGPSAGRRVGRASRRLAGTAATVAATGAAALWLTGGCSAGEAVALYACSLVVGAMVLHIADHVADFRGQ